MWLAVAAVTHSTYRFAESSEEYKGGEQIYYFWRANRVDRPEICMHIDIHMVKITLLYLDLVVGD
jgi:hypothetical protein